MAAAAANEKHGGKHESNVVMKAKMAVISEIENGENSKRGIIVMAAAIVAAS